MKTNKIIIWLSLPLTSLIIIVSCVGLFTPGFYSEETLNWQAQCIGQDLIDLFLITPFLLISATLAWRNNKTGMIIWGGIITYLLYTFTIFCFAVHFNRLLIAYCFILGLSAYSFAYFLLSFTRELSFDTFGNHGIRKATGIYFLIISLVFYFLWLSEIIPAVINNLPPKSLVETGLFTNPVQVLDLSAVLPGIFITGLLVLKGNKLGLLLAPVILVFFVLMDITIAGLVFIMKWKGIENDLKVAVIMGMLSLISLCMLAWYLRSIKIESPKA